MPTAHHARQRSPPPNVKKTAVRAPGPSALTRKPSSAKLANKGGRDKVGPTEECIDRDEDDDMATGFLQFCAMCEKQIVVPDNTILYCSQSCRRKDAEKMPEENDYSILHRSSSSGYMADMNDPLGLIGRTGGNRRSPITTLAAYSKPPMLHDAKSDLDPTEWKPDLKQRAVSDASEAFQYLSQFHRSTPVLSSRRPALPARRTPSTLTTAFTTPSLSHTPTTSSPSSEISPSGTPYEFAAGPTSPPLLLPSKLEVDATYSTRPPSSNSIGLMAQGPSHENLSGAPTGKSLSAGRGGMMSLRRAKVEGGVMYEKEKSWVVLEEESIRGSLNKLLRMREGMELGGM